MAKEESGGRCDRTLGALLSRDMTASDDTSLIEDGEGSTATIERDATYPGAFCVRVQPAESLSTRLEQWVLPAASERPDFFPEGVRFFSDLSCTVALQGGTSRITWKDDSAVERSMPASLREALKARSSNRRTGESREGEVSVLSIAEELGDPAAVEWVVARSRPSEPAPRFINMFERMVNEWLNEGWREEDARVESSRVARSKHLRRDGRERTLTLSSAGGMDFLAMTDRRVTPPSS